MVGSANHCNKVSSPPLCIRLGRHWGPTSNLHRQAARGSGSYCPDQLLYRENEPSRRCGRKPDCVCRECCERTMQGASPNKSHLLYYDSPPGRQRWATYSREGRGPCPCWDRKRKAWRFLRSAELFRLHQRLWSPALDQVFDQGKRRNGFL